MDANLKAKWIEALRSGEFRQGSGMLHDAHNDSFCCLGVLCKVVGAEFTSATEEDEFYTTFDHVPVFEGAILSSRDDEELKDTFAEKIGIPDQKVLIELNDGRGSDPNDPGYIHPSTFPEIADYIEANIPADPALIGNERP